jgi:hypothetical protein
MPTIIAICPYCRAGGVRAPASALGASATCPRCKCSFTVMPSESARPGVAAPVVETVPSAALPDETEPSPVMPAEGRPAPQAEKRPKRAKSGVPVARVIAPPPGKSARVELSSVVIAPPPAESTRAEASGATYPLEAEPVARRGWGGEAVPAPAPIPSPAPTPKPKAEPAPVAAEPVEVREPAEAMDYGMVMALGALILVGPAVLASQLPLGRFIAAALGLVGLLGGIAALGAEARAKLVAAAAVFLHAVILLVVFFAPSVLNLDPWRGGTNGTGPTGPAMVEHNTGSRTPISPDTWIDASRSSWEFRDARVTVAAAHSGPVELRGPKDGRRTTKEYYFQVQLRITNAGVERQIDLSGWAAGQGSEGIRLTDAAGAPLSLATFEGPWQPDRGKPAKQALPGHPSDVKLVFAAPPAGSGPLRLQLPGAALGLPDETVKFQLGAAFLPRPTP